jgi:hypothetical protein
MFQNNNNNNNKREKESEKGALCIDIIQRGNCELDKRTNNDAIESTYLEVNKIVKRTRFAVRT